MEGYEDFNETVEEEDERIDWKRIDDKQRYEDIKSTQDSWK